MRIVSWNVNSVRVRLEILCGFLREHAPDVVCLQETKVIDDLFPREAIEDCGYNLYTHGQKTYNGTAVLSRRPCEVTERGLPGLDDPQARYIEVLHTEETGEARRIASIYLPNGNPVAEKYDYKRRWMHALAAHAQTLLGYEEKTYLCGDFNIIPEPIDAADPEGWRRDALFLPESRDAFRALLNAGWRDGVRLCSPAPQVYTFWDYRSGAFDRNDGVRIDHILASPRAAHEVRDFRVYTDIRALPQTSDHAPIECMLAPPE